MRCCPSAGDSKMPILIKNLVCNDMPWIYTGNRFFSRCAKSQMYICSKIGAAFFWIEAANIAVSDDTS